MVMVSFQSRVTHTLPFHKQSVPSLTPIVPLAEFLDAFQVVDVEQDGRKGDKGEPEGIER